MNSPSQWAVCMFQNLGLLSSQAYISNPCDHLKADLIAFTNPISQAEWAIQIMNYVITS